LRESHARIVWLLLALHHAWIYHSHLLEALLTERILTLDDE